MDLATIAIFQGRKAAETIHNRFRNIEPEPVEEKPVITHDKMVLSYYESKARNEAFEIPAEDRLKELGYGNHFYTNRRSKLLMKQCGV